LSGQAGSHQRITAIYPIVYIDELVVKVRDGAHVVLQIGEPVLEQVGKSGGAVPEQRKGVRLVGVLGTARRRRSRGVSRRMA
jgi:hypothetical protein